MRWNGSFAPGVLALGLALSGCDGGRSGTDAGGTDSGLADSGGGGDDGGTTDAGSSDAGSSDAGPDGGTTPLTPREQIRAARDAIPATVESPPATATIDPRRAIEGVTVTYIKPATGTDAAGFFVQAEMTGPALFVQIDPSTLTPSPQVGDVVSFEVSEVANVEGRAHATAIESFAVDSSGADVSALVQDVSAAADLHANVGDYESELVTIHGTIAGNFTASGEEHVAAPIETSAITGEPNLLFRVPAYLRSSLDLAPNCEVTATGPVWRYVGSGSSTLRRTQPSAYRPEDIVITSCPAPQPIGAVALSPTEVLVTFDRLIDPASVTDAATQFTFDNGLTATAADVNGREVTLTTSTQAGGTTYTLTVAESVTDIRGEGVAAPGTITFDGFETPAVVWINEFNANIAMMCDLVELRVVTGGLMAGYRLLERSTSILEFPTGFRVATDEIIVVHLNRGEEACTGHLGPPDDETGAPDEQPTSSFATNYDTAYDFYVEDGGLVATDIVIQLRDATGTIVDAVFASNTPVIPKGTVANSARDTELAAMAVAAAGEWTMVDGSVPSGGFVDNDFHLHAVHDLDATAVNGGNSLQRTTDIDTNSTDGWTQADSSWGTLNGGQTPF